MNKCHECGAYWSMESVWLRIYVWLELAKQKLLSKVFSKELADANKGIDQLKRMAAEEYARRLPRTRLLAEYIRLDKTIERMPVGYESYRRLKDAWMTDSHLIKFQFMFDLYCKPGTTADSIRLKQDMTPETHDELTVHIFTKYGVYIEEM